MNPKIKEKIKNMIHSDDREVIALGETLFWNSDPLFMDLQYMAKSDPPIINYWEFYRLKNKGRAYLKKYYMYVYKRGSLYKHPT